MAVVVTLEVKRSVVVTFYAKEDSNSPYQGRLEFSDADYDALTPDDVKAKATEQFTAWKAALAAAQSDAALAAAAAAAALIVPASITAPQARRAVVQAGLKDIVEAAIAAAGPITKNLWYTAEIIHRDNPTLMALAANIGLSSDQLDDLFHMGAKL